MKTNVMRILDKGNISYAVHTYDSGDGLIDGVSVAGKIGIPASHVFKTLIAKGAGGEHYCFILPVEKELHLKAAAKCAGEKSMEMIKAADITAVTGYVRGGCSPIGLKKPLATFIDSAVNSIDTIVISGGKIGAQIALSPKDLIPFIHAKVDDITDSTG